jgi:hypothetical protein
MPKLDLSQLQAGAGSVMSGEPLVFWGQKANPAFGGEFHGGDRRNPLSPVIIETRTVDEATIAFYQEWSDEERAAWTRRMWTNGFIQDPYDIEGGFAQWARAVQRASAMYMNARPGATRKKVTPWMVMEMMEGGRPPQDGPKTTTRRDVVVPNTEDVNATIYSIFKEANGRAPNDAELSRYRGMLTARYRANPTVTTTTTDPDGNTSSTTQQGYSDQAAQFDVFKRAQADPEYAAYQAATTRFNALVAALGAPGGP